MLSFLCYSQSKSTADTTKSTYYWSGKTLTEKEFKDTLREYFYRFNDSLRRTIILKRVTDSIEKIDSLQKRKNR